mgnify:CR=1 FL=1
MAKRRGMRLKNGGIGNYSRCNEFESNFATTLHWIIWKWAAMRGICSGERESLFGMRCEPQSDVRDGGAWAWCLKVHHLDQVRARLCKYACYIIQEAEQINQCIMGLRSEKLPKLQETICSYTILPSKRQQQSVRSGVIKCSNSKIKLNVDALQIEQNLNSYF